MTAPPWANKRRDTGEAADVDALRRIGALVWKLHTPADLLIYYRGCLYLADRKNKHGKLTDAQSKAVAVGWPIRYYESTDELIEAITGHANPSKTRTTYGNKGL